MMIITKKRIPGAKPTQEQIARIEAAKQIPFVYDEDCPPMTEEQLAQFKPLYPYREERAQ